MRDGEGPTGTPARFLDSDGPPLKAMAGMSFGETAAARERVFLNPSAQAQGKPAGPAITQAKLANGLDIVVIPDRRAPVVTHMVWYRNGSADDPPGKSGSAHFLEHLMFKGTKANPLGKVSRAYRGSRRPGECLYRQ